MDIIKILELFGLESLRNKRPVIFYTIMTVILLMAIFLIFGKPVEEFYKAHLKKEQLFNVSVKLYTSDGKLKKPFLNSFLSIGLNSVDKSWDATISSEGIAQYRNLISIELKYENVLIAIVSDQYQLADDTKLYSLADTIYAKVKPTPESYQVEIKDSVPLVQTIVSCPNRNPDGVLLTRLNHDKPGENPGNKWVSGYYYKKNGVCVWQKGKWIKLTINECPKAPPNGYKEDKVGTGRKGYFWQTGRWVLQNNECIWRSGSWQKSQVGSSTNLKPTFAPPLSKN